MASTNISWTDNVWNPSVGCSRVSSGCEHCYAETFANRLEAMGQARYKGLTVIGNHGARWTGEVRPVPEVLAAPLGWKKHPASLDSESKGTLAAFCRQLGIKLASPQALMELSRGLTVHADHKVVQYVNVGTGEAQISFGETHTDATGAPVKVSGGFAIAIPVFRDGPAYQIPVRLRYKVAGGQVKWTLQPQRIDEVFDDAVSEGVNNVTTKTSLPTIYGTPET